MISFLADDDSRAKNRRRSSIIHPFISFDEPEEDSDEEDQYSSDEPTEIVPNPGMPNPGMKPNFKLNGHIDKNNKTPDVEAVQPKATKTSRRSSAFGLIGISEAFNPTR